MGDIEIFACLMKWVCSHQSQKLFILFLEDAFCTDYLLVESSRAMYHVFAMLCSELCCSSIRLAGWLSSVVLMTRAGGIVTTTGSKHEWTIPSIFLSLANILLSRMFHTAKYRLRYADYPEWSVQKLYFPLYKNKKQIGY